ncbi:MAG: HD domain-containing protein [Firmicutes bacterium]|nr:HD domain-containing protein [Bacillota bacterium]MDD7601803.1 HD domain-containing protein [Bacillota bacterium]MDY5855816.1 HD domain-containing protein [Anaerovoracaceae bacterium]
MNRLLKLENLLLDVIGQQEGKMEKRDETLNWERIHMASSARLAWEMALERKDADPEIAACAAAVHDFGRILTGRQKDHAEAGYAPVKEFLQKSGLFSAEETEEIAQAVRHHSSKTVTGTPLEEIVKDADVVDCFQYGYPFDRPEKEVRYQAWLEKRTNGN